MCMKPRKAQPGPRYGALLQVLRTSEALWNASRVFFERWQISPSQFNLLNIVRSHPEGLTQIELSRELMVHRSNVTGLIDRLEKRGLVCRKENPADRRAWRVVLTPEGAQLLEAILPYYHRVAEAAWGSISIQRAQELAEE